MEIKRALLEFYPFAGVDIYFDNALATYLLLIKFVENHNVHFKKSFAVHS